MGTLDEAAEQLFARRCSRRDAAPSDDRLAAGGCTDLRIAVNNWPTAMAADDGHKVTPASKQAGLIGAGQLFARPCSRPDGETATTNWPATSSELRARGLSPTECAELLEILDSGLNCLLAVWTPPACRRLSANFQHWLMGWITPSRNCFDSAETESFRSRLQRRLSRLFGECRR